MTAWSLLGEVDPRQTGNEELNTNVTSYGRHDRMSPQLSASDTDAHGTVRPVRDAAGCPLTLIEIIFSHDETLTATSLLP